MSKFWVNWVNAVTLVLTTSVVAELLTNFFLAASFGALWSLIWQGIACAFFCIWLVDRFFGSEGKESWPYLVVWIVGFILSVGVMLEQSRFQYETMAGTSFPITLLVAVAAGGTLFFRFGQGKRRLAGVVVAIPALIMAVPALRDFNRDFSAQREVYYSFQPRALQCLSYSPDSELPTVSSVPFSNHFDDGVLAGRLKLIDHRDGTPVAISNFPVPKRSIPRAWRVSRCSENTCVSLLIPGDARAPTKGLMWRIGKDSVESLKLVIKWTDLDIDGDQFKSVNTECRADLK